MRGARNWWLPLAQRLFVGESRRVTHPDDSRSSTIVRNEHDRWSVSCFRRGYDVVHKAYVLPHVAPTLSNDIQLPSDRVPLAELATHLQEWCVGYLLRSGVSTLMLPTLTFSTERQRLLIEDGGGLIMGRDMTGKSSAKWVIYRNPKGYLGTVDGTPILVEDPLSYYKLKYCVGNQFSPIAMLGTSLVTRLQRALNGQPEIHLMMDGDVAGRRAAQRIMRGLVGVGKFHVHELPQDKDPKDLSISQLLEYLK